MAVITAMAPTVARADDRRLAIPTPLDQYTGLPAAESPYLYLNRCTGGCTITGGANDAAGRSSSIPTAGAHMIGEFTNVFGQTGAAGTCLVDNTTPCTADAQCPLDGSMQPTKCDTADYEWGLVVQCMKEVYSPYAITLSDQQPVGVAYTEAIIAGQPGDIGQAGDILGVAPLAGDCSAQNNVISFTFANHHPPGAHALNVCWTAAQESAHAFGLDHEYQFLDGRSACNDPMTYRADCGGEKFFRNFEAQCGEYTTRACRCTATQNSHVRLIKVFGTGTPITAPPVIQIVTPLSGTIGPTAGVHASASAQRGIAKVELWLNNSKWLEVPGAPFGQTGQGVADYLMVLPANVPNSILDIVTKAYDDLGTETDSQTVTVTLGPAGGCTDASGCLPEQKCSAGKCYWDPPTSGLGATCTYNQACTTWDCADLGAGHKQCTQSCSPYEDGSCPSGFVCATAGNTGFCVADTGGGGCCSASERSWPGAGALSFAVGVVVLRRGRRRSRRRR